MDPDEDPVGSPRRPHGHGPPSSRRARGDGPRADNAAALPNSSRRAAARRQREAMTGSGRSVSNSSVASGQGHDRLSSSDRGHGRSVKAVGRSRPLSSSLQGDSDRRHHRQSSSRHAESKGAGGSSSTGRRRDSSSRAGGSRVDRSDRSARSYRTAGSHRHHPSAKSSSRPSGSRRDSKEERKPSHESVASSRRNRSESDESSEEFIDFTSDVESEEDDHDDFTETPSSTYDDDVGTALTAASGAGDGFEEAIEEQEYSSRCGDTTVHDSRGGGSGSSRASRRRRSVDDDRDGCRFESIREDDGDSFLSLEGDVTVHDTVNDTIILPDRLSPERNPHRSDRSADVGTEKFLALTDAPNREVDAASAADMTFTEVLSKFDPPTSADDSGRASTPTNLEPDLDAKSYFSRFDAPPSPSGPEPNRHKGRRRSDGGSGSAHESSEDDAGGITRPAVTRGQDPPESGRGDDPAQAGAADPPPYRGGSPTYRKPKRGEAEAGPRRPEIKGILKKRGAPIPITQFGRPVFDEDDSDSDGSDGSDGKSDDHGRSDPDVTEEKSLRSAPPAFSIGGDDDRSAYSSATQTTLGTVGTARSGLRSGKWAAANERALAAQAGHISEEEDEEGEEEGTEYDYEDPEYDALSAASDEHTLKSTNDARFDRTKSHFLRTADLGLTQDTIFAEQFLEDDRTKPEPHYHHPSPHPPPGVQFNIDENWVSVDDGRGGHSPIAPQAVDALVAMGYRAAVSYSYRVSVS